MSLNKPIDFHLRCKKKRERQKWGKEVHFWSSQSVEKITKNINEGSLVGLFSTTESGIK